MIAKNIITHTQTDEIVWPSTFRNTFTKLIFTFIGLKVKIVLWQQKLFQAKWNNSFMLCLRCTESVKCLSSGEIYVISALPNWWSMSISQHNAAQWWIYANNVSYGRGKLNHQIGWYGINIGTRFKWISNIYKTSCYGCIEIKKNNYHLEENF